LRLFVGIQIPQAHHPVLQSLQSGLVDARWISSANFHVTLRFIGDVEEDMSRDITLSLARIEAAPFTMELSGLDFFGRRWPRSLWTGIEPKEPLTQLASKVDTALAQCNVNLEARKYTPHVTLAYLKGTNEHEVMKYISERAPFNGPAVEISEFSLLSSTLGSEGAAHRIIETYPLTG
jgi:2'-5' RNA ligase